MSAKIDIYLEEIWCLCPRRMCSCAVAYLCIFCTPEWVTACDKHNGKQAKDQLLVCREFNWTCSILFCRVRFEQDRKVARARLEAVQWAHVPGSTCGAFFFPSAVSLSLEHWLCCHSTYCRSHLVADLLCIHMSPRIANPFPLLLQRVYLSLHQQT